MQQRTSARAHARAHTAALVPATQLNQAAIQLSEHMLACLANYQHPPVRIPVNPSRTVVVLILSS